MKPEILHIQVIVKGIKDGKTVWRWPFHVPESSGFTERSFAEFAIQYVKKRMQDQDVIDRCGPMDGMTLEILSATGSIPGWQP